MPFDKSKFIERFKTETKEHLEKLSLGLLKLEKDPKDHELLEAMMREAHTIKGSSTMMGYNRISGIAHWMEDGLENAMKGKLVLEKAHIDVLFKGLDTIEPLLEDKVTWEAKGITGSCVDDLCREIEDVFAGRTTKGSRVKGQVARVKAEEKPAKEKITQVPPHVTEESIRVDIEKLDKLVNVSGELLISKIRLTELVKTLINKTESHEESREFLGTLVKDFEKVKSNIDLLTADMQNEIMQVRMVPVSFLFNTFPRAMRDLAREKEKDIDFEIRGEDTQLDKAIIDEMKDPIMHLLRNAVDHGIEAPDERKTKNKPQTGKIILSAYQEGSQVVVEVSDDGNGINAEKVKKEAVKKNLIVSSRINEMIDEQVYQILFTPGFSTKESVSETSGRGVGLDVVRENIASLKGMVEVKSAAGKGVRFIMRVPLTLAITESLLVAAGSDIFAIPIDTVVETIRVSPDDIKTVETKDAITVRGHIIPLVRLNDIFGLPRRGIIEKKFLPVVVVQSVEKRVAILVDELMGRQEIISKAIGDLLKNMKNVAGATILGSGKVVLILDIPSIIEAAEGAIIKRSSVKAKEAPKAKKKKTILLAEDVLSTAMLEKNILESVGYSVVIARDGKEALERASQEMFDLVITDVLMPRMDGFELVSGLRKNKLYKDVPIIIVTTRESDADKRRGLTAGADAYLLKSEFTGEGLLDTIERLLG